MNKKQSLSVPLALLSTLLFTTTALAYEDYYSTTSSEDELFGSLFLGGFVFLCYCIPLVLGIILYIWMVVWTYKDATKKNNPNALLWAVLVLIFQFVAFIIYLFVRNDHLKNAPVTTPVQDSSKK